MLRQRHFKEGQTIATPAISGHGVWTVITGPPGSDDYVSEIEHFTREEDAIAKWHEKCNAFLYIGFEEVV